LKKEFQRDAVPYPRLTPSIRASPVLLKPRKGLIKEVMMIIIRINLLGVLVSDVTILFSMVSYPK